MESFSTIGSLADMVLFYLQQLLYQSVSFKMQTFWNKNVIMIFVKGYISIGIAVGNCISVVNRPVQPLRNLNSALLFFRDYIYSLFEIYL